MPKSTLFDRVVYRSLLTFFGGGQGQSCRCRDGGSLGTSRSDNWGKFFPPDDPLETCQSIFALLWFASIFF
jgi:hypothetical protein